MEGCNNQLNLLMRSSDLYAGAYNGLEDKLAPSSAQLHLWHTELYDCFTFAKETADSGIMFPPVQPNRASTIVTSDASWASARCHKSQFGLVVTICSITSFWTGKQDDLLVFAVQLWHPRYALVMKHLIVHVIQT